MGVHFLESITCPNCGASIDLHAQSTDGARVDCAACGTQFILRGHVCPHCGTYHEHEVNFCRQCGATLTRNCPQCNAVNWIGDEYCIQCGSALDILELIVQRHNQDTEGRLYQQMEDAQRLKEAELAASQARYSRMLERERAEQAALRKRILKQKQQEKKALTIVLGVVVVIVVIVVIVAIVAGL